MSSFLSPHFLVHEWTRNRYNLPNEPTEIQLDRGKALFLGVVEPFRELAGPTNVKSGFRSPQVNELADGHPDSPHLYGEAADLCPMSIRNNATQMTFRMQCDLLQGLLERLVMNLRIKGQPWDQLIFYPDPARAHPFLHVSRKTDRAERHPNRFDVLVSPRKGVYRPHSTIS
jgi:hypothetical protein